MTGSASKLPIVWHRTEALSPDELLPILRNQNASLKELRVHRLARRWIARTEGTTLPSGSVNIMACSELEGVGTSEAAAIFLFSPSGRNAVSFGNRRYGYTGRNTVLLPAESYRTFYSELQSRMTFVVRRDRFEDFLRHFGLGEERIAATRAGNFDTGRWTYFERQLESSLQLLRTASGQMLDRDRYLAAQEDLLLLAVADALGHDGSTLPERSAPYAHVRARDFIAAHADHTLRLAEIAQASGLSIRALETSFRVHEEMTVSEYLLAERLRRARERLQVPEGRSLRDIARESGFAHYGTFVRAFRARYGEAPVANSGEMIQLRNRC